MSLIIFKYIHLKYKTKLTLVQRDRMIPLANPKLGIDEETINSIIEVLKDGRYILGDKNKEFGKKFADFIGTKHAIATSSGTSSLHMALLACGIKTGDEVITTSFTFIATVNPILYCGAKPVFVDIDPKTYNINPDLIEEKITDKTKAILPVHFYGHPADMDPILEIAEKYNLKIIEDACQAHGTSYKNKKVGSFGDLGCFSFYPSKNMTVCGDGGMITTNDYEIKEKIIMLRNQGRKRGQKYKHEIIGFNYRMNEISAAVGISQLKKLPNWIKQRRKIASYYSKLLGNLDDIILPTEKKWATHVYYVYTIRTEQRDELMKWLQKNGIGAGIYYPLPIHLQPPYRSLGFSTGTLPITEEFANKILSLPIHQFLTKKDVLFIADKIKKFFGR